MKKITFIILFLFGIMTNLSAQVSFSGNPVYGRLTNFVYDATTQNKLYATSLDKHIMVSTDNGTTWNILHTISDYPFLAPVIKQMKLTNNKTALSFVEYYGNGSSLNKITILDLETLTVLKQYSMPEVQLGQNFGSYTIHDDGTFNIAYILANGTTDKTYYTTDGGENWEKVFDAVDYEGVLVNDAVMDPANPEKLYIARNGGPGNVDGGLLISEDAGQNWTLTLDGLVLQTVAINPTNSNEIYAGTGVIWAYPTQNQALYHSIDGGATWTTISSIVWSDGGLDNIPHIAFNSYNTNHVVVLSDDQIAVTTDAGTTWTMTQHLGASGDDYFIGEGVAFNPTDATVFISNNRNGSKSVDGGITLTKVQNPFYEVMGNMEIISNGAEKHLMYGVQFGYVDRNLSTEVETPIDVMPIYEFPMGGQIYQMRSDADVAGRTYSYASSFMGNSLQVSNDYGLTKTAIYSSFDTQFTAVDTDPTNNNIAWLATFNGMNSTVVKVDFSNFDDVQTTYITLPNDADWIYGLHINSNNADEVMITVGNELYKTTDGGENWEQITDGLDDLVLPNIALSLIQNPLDANQFTMATSNGIYTSTDGGATWARIYEEMINSVKHSSETNGHIVGVGYSIQDILPKVIYSSDGGATWTEKTSENYFNTIVTSSAIKFNADSADVYLGTLSLGLLKDQVEFSTLGTPNVGNSKSNVMVFPNPTNGIINIQLNKGNAVTSAILYSMTGQKLMESNQDKIDISNLSNGVYLLKVSDAKGASETKQIIKR